jgi:O-antigen/teichoic acid export membrane protein
MAFAGLGVWALIVPTLIVPLPFVYDLFVTAGWRPSWQFSWSRFQPAWQFGLTRILTLTIVAAGTVAESLTLASALGFALLGIFGRAVGLAQLLCGRLASLLAIAIYPVLTRVPASTEAFRRAGALYLRAVAWSVIPAAVLAGLLASPIVRVLYGAKWVAAIPYVPWAMGGAALAAMAQTAYTVLLANGQQRACVAVDGWKTAGVLAALLLALPSGPGRYLAVLAFVHLISLVIVSALLWRTGGLSEPAVFNAVLPASVSAGLATIGMLTIVSVVGGRESLWAFAVGAPCFVVMYLVALRVFFKSSLSEVVGHMPRSGALMRALRLA